MSKFTDAADAIKRQVKTLEQWQLAAEVLDQIGSLDNATKEAQAALNKLRGECDVALADLGKVKADAKTTKDKVAATLLTAEADAERIVNEAKEKAGGIEASAKGKAEEVIELAKANAANVTSTARATVDALNKQRSEAEGKLAEVTGKVAEAEDKLVKVTKQLDTLKSKLSALMGE